MLCCHACLPPRDRQRAIALAAVKDKPFGWPRKARPSLTATRYDGAVELRSGRKNGSAGVKQKNGSESSFRAKILSSRYARAAINFPGTKNRNTRGFSHQTPWSCLRLGEAAWPVVARAQQPKLPVIGYLGTQFADDDYKIITVPFLRGLKETGYVEGQNVVIGCRSLRPISSAAG